MLDIQYINQLAGSITDREVLATTLQQNDDFLVDPNNTYRWYYALAAAAKPNSILELGVRYGYSAVAMLRGILHATGSSSNAVYIGIDSEFDGIPSNAIALQNIHWLNRHLATVLKYSTDNPAMDENIEIMRGGHVPFDLVHIDANHTLEGINTELAVALRWTAKGSLIIVDDLDIPYVRQISMEFAQVHSWPSFELPTVHQALIIVRES